MTTTTRYILKKLSPCPDCDGIGVLAHPKWRRYHDWHDAYRESHHNCSPSDDATNTWWSENGYYLNSRPDLPPQEIACYTCSGTGKLEQDIDLRSALTALGINITYSNLQP